MPKKAEPLEHDTLSSDMHLHSPKAPLNSWSTKKELTYPWFRLEFQFKNGRLAPDVYLSSKDEVNASRTAQLIKHPMKNARFNGRITSCFNIPILALVSTSEGVVTFQSYKPDNNIQL